jgi:hypothetical protein
MNSKGKYIGLNQRIPFEVLDSAINYYLEHELIDKEYIFQRIQESTAGLNRAKKATNFVIQIITRHVQLLNQLKNVIKEVPYNSLRVEDRKALCLCFLCLNFPIIYDLLVALGQGFKVQSQINKKFISEKVKILYGSNRSVDLAIDALLPMIIELNTIKRDKISLYSLASKLVVKNKFAIELVVYTDIKLSGSKSILIDDLNYKPWFSYFDISTIGSDNFIIISKKDSAIGKGYLTIKT